MINFVLDGVIIFLLVTTVGYSWRLSKRIRVLQDSRGDLNTFIQEFNQSIERAETNIEALKELGEETDNQLVVHINKARFLANDLSFLNEKGEDIADSLEFYISSSRSIANGDGENVSTTKPPRKAPRDTPSARAQKREAELNGINTSAKNERENKGKQKALETLMEEIAKRKASAFQPSLSAANETNANSAPGERQHMKNAPSPDAPRKNKRMTHGKGNSALFNLPKNRNETSRPRGQQPERRGLQEPIDT